MDSKSELPSPKEPKSHPPITSEFLAATFSSPDFIRNLERVTTFTYRSNRESGFLVQNLDGPKIVKHKPVFGAEYESRRFQREMMDKDGVPFKNVVIDLHTHPIDAGERIEMTVAPSEADIRAWEELRMAKWEYGGGRENPFRIFGIASRDPHDFKKTWLFLFQADPAKVQNTNYQQYDEQTDAVEKLYRLMGESGIRHTLLQVKKGEGLADTELAKALMFATA